jgi:hypothetical protein
LKYEADDSCRGKLQNVKPQISGFSQQELVTVDASSVDPANEGKLVHLTAKAVTDETLADDMFGVSANAIKLRRNVEMYQWKEKQKN